MILNKYSFYDFLLTVEEIKNNNIYLKNISLLLHRANKININKNRTKYKKHNWTEKTLNASFIVHNSHSMFLDVSILPHLLIW